MYLKSVTRETAGLSEKTQSNLRLFYLAALHVPLLVHANLYTEITKQEKGYI